MNRKSKVIIRTAIIVSYYLIVYFLEYYEIISTALGHIFSPIEKLGDGPFAGLLLLIVGVITVIMFFYFAFVPFLHIEKLNKLLGIEPIETLKDHTTKLEEVKSQLESFIEITDKLKNTITTQWQENERLKSENFHLLSTKDESSKELISKLVAYELVRKNKNRKERWLAFAMGVVASLLAAYIFQFIGFKQ